MKWSVKARRSSDPRGAQEPRRSEGFPRVPKLFLGGRRVGDLESAFCLAPSGPWCAVRDLEGKLGQSWGGFRQGRAHMATSYPRNCPVAHWNPTHQWSGDAAKGRCNPFQSFPVKGSLKNTRAPMTYRVPVQSVWKFNVGLGSLAFRASQEVRKSK